jgi:AAA+ superfamily predicted ATPase
MTISASKVTDAKTNRAINSKNKKSRVAQTKAETPEAQASAFVDGNDFLQDYLLMLTLVLHREVALMREMRGESRQESFLGLFLSDQDMDAILSELAQASGPHLSNLPASQNGKQYAQNLSQQIAAQGELINARTRATKTLLPHQKLQGIFNLSQTELKLILLCLAPEIDTRFARVYGFLHDDLACKLPSMALVESLIQAIPSIQKPSLQEQADSNELENNKRTSSVALHESGTLRCYNILQKQTHSSHLHQQTSLRLHPRLADYLCEIDQLDAKALEQYESAKFAGIQLCDDAFYEQIQNALELWQSQPQAHMLVSKDADDAELWAQVFAQQAGLYLDIVDCSTWKNFAESELQNMMSALAFEAHINSRLLLLKHVNTISHFGAQKLQSLVSPLFLLHATASPSHSEHLHKIIDARLFQSYHLPVLSTQQMRNCCQQILAIFTQRYATNENPKPLKIAPSDEQWDQLLSTNKLSLTQHRAIMSELIIALSSDCRVGAKSGKAKGSAKENANSFVALYALKARSILNHQMQGLAQKIDSHFGIQDIVLTQSAKANLMNIVNYHEHHLQVMTSWGFEQLFSHTQNHACLFVGPSGTGKTMAASVIANMLQLDLFRIELASVVSKYIGETEKNLDRIFTGAQAANAILFIDEADALFGKRTAVKDAHDRYANLEVSYLLQKLEEHPALVILASNLGKNIDDAFLRRFSHVIEFTLPHQAERLQLWRKLTQSSAPLSEDIDYSFLAAKFEISGASIRNCLLHSAFLAASEKANTISMSHIVRALAKELIKQGKAINKNAFGEYYAWLKSHPENIGSG